MRGVFLPSVGHNLRASTLDTRMAGQALHGAGQGINISNRI